MRAPSYKALAFAILKNDHLLRSVGFSEKESDLWKAFRTPATEDDLQMDMFDANSQRQ